MCTRLYETDQGGRINFWLFRDRAVAKGWDEYRIARVWAHICAHRERHDREQAIIADLIERGRSERAAHRAA